MGTAPFRSHGVRFEFLRMRQGDHMAWAFAGAREFAALATSCLIEGAAQGERLMLVADDPDPSAVAALSGVVGEDDLQVMSIAEYYGTSGLLDPVEQLARLADEVQGALTAGYSGLRIVADNTPLVVNDVGLVAWRRYEMLGDQFAAVHPVTLLCAFDTQRLGRKRLSWLAGMHPLSSASGPVPSFRLFFQGNSLQLAGTVNEASLTSLREALAELPPGTPAAVDLGPASSGPPGPGPGDLWAADLDAAAKVSGCLVAILNDIAIDGTPLTVLGSAGVLEAVRAAFPPPSASLVLRQY